MSGYGYHYGPCVGGDGGGGGGRRGHAGRKIALLLALVIVVAIAAQAHTIERAAVETLDVVAVVLGVVLALAVLAGATVITVKVRRARARRLPAAPERMTLTAVPVRPGLPRADDVTALPRANASAHPRIDVTPDVVTRQVTRPRRYGRWS